MDHDDHPVGRILSRREALALLAASGSTMLSPFTGVLSGAPTPQAPLPGCLVRPEVIEGPYFVDRTLNRSDIRPEPSTGALSPGVALTVAFNVTDVSGGACVPLEGAMVDVWQCDALGEYSAFDDRRVGFDTRGKTFLRGYQATDGSGLARFTTIYPGWYTGRATHIHFQVRTTSAPGRTWEFTSQLFFDDDLTDRVHAQPPYAAKGPRDTRNATDQFMTRGDEQLILALVPRGDAFDTTFGIGLDLADGETGRPDSGRRTPGGPPRP